MKPILLDALHINMGGALMILNHLVNRLVARNIDFVLLKDDRCPKLDSESSIGNIYVSPSSIANRRRFYREHENDYSAVLCLGNVPPEIKLPVATHTLMHNVSLLAIPTDNSPKQKIANYLKRCYIRHYASNTDTWIVQTTHTARLLDGYINRGSRPIEVYPFYFVPDNINMVPFEKRHDYVFIGEHTGAKGHEYLIDAWGELAKKDIRPVLHLTSNSPLLEGRIKSAIDKGARIENHGYVSFEEVVKIYNKSKATVYPSLNESLGLGIIEAGESGCDIIGCDLPYLHAVCQPSAVFEPRNVEAIVSAVASYEMGECDRSHLTINDMVDNLIDFVRTYEA
ncbi:MAG: glycosyltransferase [Bacteroides sp.]|nr:glycosyltransferase [Bacteroides sp.]